VFDRILRPDDALDRCRPDRTIDPARSWPHHGTRADGRFGLVRRLWAFAAIAILAAACGGGPGATPPITPGTSGQPREVNIIAKDYEFEPPVVDLVPGETVIFHIINGGLVVHEAVFGDQRVQDAWEIAEAGAADPPPGPTPMVSVPPNVGGLRVVVASGQRVDVRWTVPRGAVPGSSASGSASVPVVGTGADSGLIVGCHIAGHYAKGMHVPIRLVATAH
jgi:hypothetical protein